MKAVHPLPRKNNAPDLPLFAAADRAHVRSLSYPARKLARRLGLTAATARNIAQLAGFKPEHRL